LGRIAATEAWLPWVSNREDAQAAKLRSVRLQMAEDLYQRFSATGDATRTNMLLNMGRLPAGFTQGAFWVDYRIAL